MGKGGEVRFGVVDLDGDIDIVSVNGEDEHVVLRRKNSLLSHRVWGPLHSCGRFRRSEWAA